MHCQVNVSVVACVTDTSVSCRSLVLHSLDVSDTGCKSSCLRKITTTGTIYDVAVDHLMDVAITVSEVSKDDKESVLPSDFQLKYETVL